MMQREVAALGLAGSRIAVDRERDRRAEVLPCRSMSRAT
jgi:hypothetical protein